MTWSSSCPSGCRKINTNCQEAALCGFVIHTSESETKDIFLQKATAGTETAPQIQKAV